MNDQKKDQVSSSLSSLHEKQDEQTKTIHEVKTELATQKIILDIYTKQQEQIATQLSSVNDRLTEYNHQLKVHIQGVQELKTQNQLIREEMNLRSKEWSARMDIAEKPIKWAESTLSGLKWAAAASAAIMSIIGLLKLIGIL